MARTLPLHRMVPVAPLEGVVVIEAMPDDDEIVRRIWDAMEPQKDSRGAIIEFMFPVPGCPPMRPEPGFIEFVSLLFLSSRSFLLIF